MDKICRLCSQKSPHLTSIFSFKMDRLLSDMILIICPIKIDASDELPKSICKACLKLVLDAISLRERSVKSDLKFRTKSLAMETPEMVRVNQDIDPFYSTTFFESDSENERDAERDKKRLRRSAPEIKQFDNDNSNSDNFSESASDYKNMTSYDPPWKKSKKYEVHDKNRYKCPLCTATFTFPTNVRRHIKQVHNSDDPQPRQIRQPKSTQPTESLCCAVCGMSFTNSSNMRRHIRNIHSDTIDDTVALKYKMKTIDPNEYRLTDEIQKAFDESEELTKKYFWQPINKRFTQYVVVIGEDPHRTFTYRCLLCEKNGKDKIFEQSVKNESMSNYKRHLRTIHKIQSEKYKKVRRCMIQKMKTENETESDDNSDDEDDDDNLALSTFSKSLDIENKSENGVNKTEESKKEEHEYENGFIGGS